MIETVESLAAARHPVKTAQASPVTHINASPPPARLDSGLHNLWEVIMDSRIRVEAQAARATHYFGIMRTVCFVEVGLLAIMVFGDTSGHVLALWALILGTAVYAIVAGDQALSDIRALRDSMDEETALTPYGQAAKRVDYRLLRWINVTANAVIALALLASV